ncbi:methylmalonyl-CoA epimerase [Natronorarus salvus]|uniref:methylmalonyl-CoA epimerase n=1 Tax=Natronorarus salvus TaxID=3117733 RepID=UPI002F26D829
MHLDHVGIATDDADDLASRFTSLFDAPVAHEENFDRMRICFLALGNGYLELLEPVEDGPISRYLERDGSGIHHLAFATDDIDGALETAVESGIEPIDDEPRPGAWGHDVAFLHPRDTGGVLIEFVSHQ